MPNSPTVVTAATSPPTSMRRSDPAARACGDRNYRREGRAVVSVDDLPNSGEDHRNTGEPTLRHVIDLLDTAHHQLVVESAALSNDHPLTKIRRAIATAATDLEVYLDESPGEPGTAVVAVPRSE
jgi:hypothetical protein